MAGRTIIPQADLDLLVADQINQRMAGSEIFTAYDITLGLRDANPGFDIPHDAVRRSVHAQMDTIIAKNDPGVVTFLEPDNVAMAETVTETLFKAIGGTGNVIMTQGALGHSGARKRAEGFRRALARHPNIKLLAEDTAEWDVNKTAKLWEDYLVKFPKIDAGFFHSDDMGLAASKVIKNAGRDIKLGSVDAMPEAIEAVKDGRLLVSVRNSSVRIHWGALVLGAMAATGTKNIPKYIQIDGPVVTKEIADGMAFMEAHFLL